MTGRLLQWGVATRMLAGERASGDRHLIKFLPDGALIAVVDGLGHGVDAAHAAELALKTIKRYAGESVISLVGRCHSALLRTRGVVMSVAAFKAREATMTWLGVGNVEGVLLRADEQAAPPAESLLLRGGVVGSQLPGLRAMVFPVAPRDLLIFATDGVMSNFTYGLNIEDSPQKIADRIMDAYCKGTDDALALVARYRGYQQ